MSWNPLITTKRVIFVFKSVERKQTIYCKYNTFTSIQKTEKLLSEKLNFDLPNIQPHKMPSDASSVIQR